MENSIDYTRNSMLEWWFIFSNTGEINDAMAFMQEMRRLDLLLANEVELEM